MIRLRSIACETKQRISKVGVTNPKRGWFSQKKTNKIRRNISPEEEQQEIVTHPLLPQQRHPENVSIYSELLKAGRHVKITASGRVYSFSAFLYAGNGNGAAGLGYGKADNINKAVEKAHRDAIKNITPIYRYKDRTLPYSMKVKFRSTLLHLAVTREHGGMRGSLQLMEVAEAFGLDGITMKVHKSENVHNIMRAFVKGVTSVHPPEFTARKLGKRLLDTTKVWNPARGDKFFEQLS